MSEARPGGTGGWRDFWDRPSAIYVNERHKELHYRRIAADIIALIGGRSDVVLDHGCGEALAAGEVVNYCARLYLCDAAPTVRSSLRGRFASDPAIVVLAPEDVAGLADASLDLIVANSVAQYLSRDELIDLLGLWRAKLKPGGRLVLADVIPPDVDAVTDARALLAFARQGGFLPAAVLGLVRTYFSPYRRLRKDLGLTTYRSAALIELLQAHGFSAKRLPRNFGHNQARMAFEARLLG